MRLMHFLTLKAPVETTIEIKKSRFVAHAVPVTSRHAALETVARIKQHHPDARHHCWAYLLGDPTGSASAGMDDDGEPAGTAGRPILGVLKDRQVGNSLIVVARYFGGIKLGAAGLTRAYRQAAAEALATAELQPHEPYRLVNLDMDFSKAPLMRHWATQHQATWRSWRYTPHGITACLHLPEKQLATLQAMTARTGVALSPCNHTDADDTLHIQDRDAP